MKKLKSGANTYPGGRMTKKPSRKCCVNTAAWKRSSGKSYGPQESGYRRGYLVRNRAMYEMKMRQDPAEMEIVVARFPWGM